MTDAARIDDLLHGTGLFVRGGFHPAPADGVPPMPDGRPSRSLVLLGNAGPELWNRFVEDGPGADPRHPFDSWLTPVLDRVAAEAGAALVLPNRGPPFPPVQRWAARADAVHRSPLGLDIHPDFGLWHVYRAALLFAEKLDFPPPDDRPSPCDACTAKPCLAVCPADAFRSEGFDRHACHDHVVGPAGANCRDRGCLARRACPVGRSYAYPPDAGRFHMAAVLRAVARGV